jgi:hypothetical protein
MLQRTSASGPIVPKTASKGACVAKKTFPNDSTAGDLFASTKLPQTLVNGPSDRFPSLQSGRVTFAGFILVAHYDAPGHWQVSSAGQFSVENSLGAYAESLIHCGYAQIVTPLSRMKSIIRISFLVVGYGALIF